MEDTGQVGEKYPTWSSCPNGKGGGYERDSFPPPYHFHYGIVQPAERLALNQEAGGSTPPPVAISEPADGTPRYPPGERRQSWFEIWDEGLSVGGLPSQMPFLPWSGVE